MPTERVHKLLAHWGIASRRQAEAMIQRGRVKLNGQPIASLGTKADPDSDVISLDGRVIQPPQKHTHTLLIHKPLGVLSTCRDPQGRRTVVDLLSQDWRQRGRFYPIGRLDADSSGALLLTNDGDLTLRLSHPRYHVPKTYRVGLEGIPSPAQLEQVRRGMELVDGTTLPAKIRLIRQLDSDQSEVEIVLQEGRNRQIRRMMAHLGHPVIRLQRIAIGSLCLGALGLGKFRPLRSAEVQQLIYESNHESA